MSIQRFLKPRLLALVGLVLLGLFVSTLGVSGVRPACSTRRTLSLTGADLSSHSRGMWTWDDHYAYVQCKGPGQKFVLDLQEYSPAVAWFSGLVHDFGYCG